MAIGIQEFSQLGAGLDRMSVRSLENAPAIPKGVLKARVYAAACVLEDVIVDKNVLIDHQRVGEIRWEIEFD
ncbi:hypothetical protein GCM10007862_30800 [Dyella lipolytica]|nr:hypothetical protein GCM10007862_30800 [Dyella lipolytica]